MSLLGAQPWWATRIKSTTDVTKHVSGSGTLGNVMNKDETKRKIVNALQTDSGNLFCTKSELEGLSVSVRATIDFFLFLKTTSNKLPKGDAVYDANMTIRSCMDWFFDFLSGCNLYNDDRGFEFSWGKINGFYQLKKLFLKDFDRLLKPRGYSDEKLQLLLGLIKYQIIFLGFTFDYELLTDVQKTKAKNLSAADLKKRAEKLLFEANEMIKKPPVSNSN